MSRLERIIDANLNRAAEGLRVAEEIVRFVLEDKKATAELKKIRNDLRRIIKVDLAHRQSASDVGRDSYTKKEATRSSFLDLFSANLKRAQEALRVLEEFSKIIKPAYGKKFKALRFKVYDLEKRLSPRLQLDFGLYIITDPQRGHLAVAKAAIAGGAKIIQLRDKHASKQEFLRQAKKLRALTKKAGVTFIVNDHLDIARRVGADGVHLGQADLRKDFRKILGRDKLIGVSVSNLPQAIKAERAGADYLGVGPIFATANKPEAKAVGLNVLRQIVSKVKIPVVAIGGIKQSNINNVMKTGCRRVAVINAVLGQQDMKRAVKRLLQQIQ